MTLNPNAPKKVRVATVWLDDCSGCHMSFLDMDERLISLAGRIELVYSPLVDRKDFPTDADLTLVEGAVSSEEDLEKIKKVRSRTKLLVALGDCAVTSNVPGMRNYFGPDAYLNRAYIENAQSAQHIPNQVIPRLLKRVCPLHEAVHVDLFIQGCPPPADAIYYAISELLEGRIQTLNAVTRFGK